MGDVTDIKTRRQARIAADREAGKTFRTRSDLRKLSRLASGIQDLDQLDTIVKKADPSMQREVRVLLLSMMPKSKQRSFSKERKLIITDLSSLPDDAKPQG